MCSGTDSSSTRCGSLEYQPRPQGTRAIRQRAKHHQDLFEAGLSLRGGRAPAGRRVDRGGGHSVRGAHATTGAAHAGAGRDGGRTRWIGAGRRRGGHRQDAVRGRVRSDRRSRNLVTSMGAAWTTARRRRAGRSCRFFALRSATGRSRNPARLEMGELLRELEPRGAEPPPPLTDTAASGSWTAISRVLLTAAESTTRVLVIDELHCADESSLRVLTMLSPMLVRVRLLVIAVARDFSTRGGLDDAGGTSRATSASSDDHVAGLLAEDVAAYLMIVLGHAPADELTGAVHVRTGGNPLFVAEAVRTASNAAAATVRSAPRTCRYPRRRANSSTSDLRLWIRKPATFSMRRA